MNPMENLLQAATFPQAIPARRVAVLILESARVGARAQVGARVRVGA